MNKTFLVLAAILSLFMIQCTSAYYVQNCGSYRGCDYDDDEWTYHPVYYYNQYNTYADYYGNSDYVPYQPHCVGYGYSHYPHYTDYGYRGIYPVYSQERSDHVDVYWYDTYTYRNCDRWACW